MAAGNGKGPDRTPQKCPKCPRTFDWPAALAKHASKCTGGNDDSKATATATLDPDAVGLEGGDEVGGDGEAFAPVGDVMEGGELTTGKEAGAKLEEKPKKAGRVAAGRNAGKAVSIPQIRTQIVEVPITGKSILVVHAWSNKAIQMMLAKQMGEGNAGRENKNPRQDFLDCFYVMPGFEDTWDELKAEFLARDGDEKTKLDYRFGDGKEGRPLAPQGMFGFPAIAFKAATVGACRTVTGFPMTVARGAFHIVNDTQNWDRGDLVPLAWDKIVMRQDMVRLAQGVADIRFRPAFYGWKALLRFEVDLGTASVDQLTNLVHRGGFACGIGEHRPERNGSWGMYRVGQKGE